MRRDSGLTYDFLHRLSRRLSGRPDCKNLEYEVYIGDNIIYMKPDILVYPDTKHRKHEDKINSIDLILFNMHKTLNFEETDFVKGTYVYRFPEGQNKRRWTNKFI